MEQKFGWIANIATILGILLCVVAGIARVSGSYYFLGYESMTIFLAGAGIMLVACLAKLYQLEAKLG